MLPRVLAVPVLVNRTHKACAAGVFSRAEIVEHQTHVARQLLDCRGDAVLACAGDEADGEAAECGDIRGAVAFADCAAMFVSVPVEPVVAAVFDGPLAAIVPAHGGRQRFAGYGW